MEQQNNKIIPSFIALFNEVTFYHKILHISEYYTVLNTYHTDRHLHELAADSLLFSSDVIQNKEIHNQNQ